MEHHKNHLSRNNKFQSVKPYYDKVVWVARQVASEFNAFFSSVVIQNVTSHYPKFHKVRSIDPVSSMVLSPVGESEVVRDIQGLRPKSNINGMPVWLMKCCCKHMLTPLAKSINCLFCTAFYLLF